MVSQIVPVGSSALAEHAATVQSGLTNPDPWTRAKFAAFEWLKEQRSTGTADQYRRVINTWFLWCQEAGTNPFAAPRAVVTDFALYLKTVGSPSADPDRRKPLAQRSVARHVAAMSSFYNWSIDAEVTEKNPIPKAAREKVSRQSRQPYLDEGQGWALMAQADKDPRDSALVALLLMVCLRVSEAIRADIEDRTYWGDDVMLYVTRKGNKSGYNPVVPEAYQRIEPVIGGRRSGPIVATRTGNPLDRKAAWGRIHRLGEQAGINAPIGPHTLRHMYLTRGFELGIPAEDLRRAAGHESIETTKLYDRRPLNPQTHPSRKIAESFRGSPES